MSSIKLMSSDSCIIPVDYDVAIMSGRIKKILNNTDLTDENKETVITINDVIGRVLNQAMQWAIHHKDDPPPVEVSPKDKNSHDIILWDAEFLKHEDPEKLFSLMFAAQKLEMPALYDLVAKTIANIIKGKTTEEIRYAFGIVSDLTTEQEQQILTDDFWTESP